MGILEQVLPERFGLLHASSVKSRERQFIVTRPRIQRKIDKQSVGSKRNRQGGLGD